MLGFLFSIIIFVLFLGLIVLIVAFGFIRSFFGMFRRKNTSSQEQTQGFDSPAPKQKIFDKQEGEYVDFEEVE